MNSPQKNKRRKRHNSQFTMPEIRHTAENEKALEKGPENWRTPHLKGKNEVNVRRVPVSQREAALAAESAAPTLGVLF